MKDIQDLHTEKITASENKYKSINFPFYCVPGDAPITIEQKKNTYTQLWPLNDITAMGSKWPGPGPAEARQAEWKAQLQAEQQVPWTVVRLFLPKPLDCGQGSALALLAPPGHFTHSSTIPSPHSSVFFKCSPGAKYF